MFRAEEIGRAQIAEEAKVVLRETKGENSSSR